MRYCRMKPRAEVILVLALLTLFGASSTRSSSTPNQRPFKVHDLFELEGVGRYFGGPYAFSADGKKLAITRVRPKRTLANHKWEFLWDNAGGDIWVQFSPGDPPINITQGAEDGSGW